jgi:hypothetical protein
MRFLALTFPRLGIQLLRAGSPEFSGRPVALLAGEGDTALVSAVSCEATKDGVEIGMTLAQARQRCPGLTFERDNARQCLEHLEAMASILRARATTSVAIVSRNALVVSLDGMENQFRDEMAAAQAVLGVARSWSGLDVRGAVAGDVASAMTAARTARRFPVVVPGESAREEGLPRFEDVSAVHTFTAPAAGSEAMGRLGRLAGTLQVLLSDSPRSYRRVVLNLERGAYRTQFTFRPEQVIHRPANAAELLRQRLSPSDLEGATRFELRLESAGPSVAVEPWRPASATMHQLPPAVPVQRRLRLAS